MLDRAKNAGLIGDMPGGAQLGHAPLRAHAWIGFKINAKRRVWKNHRSLIASLRDKTRMSVGDFPLTAHHFAAHIGARGHRRHGFGDFG